MSQENDMSGYKFALYREYIGSQRRASDVRLVAAGNTEEEMQGALDTLSTGQHRFRLEDWTTGETLQILNA